MHLVKTLRSSVCENSAGRGVRRLRPVGTSDTSLILRCLSLEMVPNFRGVDRSMS